MPAFCPHCGVRAGEEGIRFCGSCGGAMSGNQSQASTQVSHMAAAAAVMQRTESTIVQVAPSYENERIQEMEMFGWNLQGRQEIHQEGDAYGAPNWSGNTYVIKTTVHHYVKLHFVRNLGLPNLNQIRTLENEYFNAPFVQPPGMKIPVLFTLFWAFGVVALLIQVNQPGSPGIGGVAMSVVGAALGILWIKSRSAKRAAAQRQNQSCVAHRQEIRSQVMGLMQKLA